MELWIIGCKLASTFVKMNQKKKKVINGKERGFVAIDPKIHDVLKKFTEEKGYNMGGFTEKAIIEKIEKEKQIN